MIQLQCPWIVENARDPVAASVYAVSIANSHASVPDDSVLVADDLFSVAIEEVLIP